MRERIKILEDLISLNGNLADLQDELAFYSWDLEVPLIQVRKINLFNVLKKCIDSEINFEELENWANAIECRDDIYFEYEEIKEIVFELANPVLNGEITKKRLKAIISELR